MVTELLPGPSRRRETATAGARGLLLTVLGEFVHPRGEPVWTATLLAAMTGLGVEEKSSRQAIARAAGEGLLHSERRGRRVRWQLSAVGTALLTEGTERIYGFQRNVVPWDGRWLVLSLAVPESRRALRHRIRTRLTWLGLGSPVAGLWVVPDATREAAVADVVRAHELGEHAFLWVGTGSALGDRAALISAAWSLDDVETAYTAFLAEFSGLQPRGGAETFRAQVELVQAWRRFPFLDPALPPELLPRAWPGARAAQTFHALHDRWNSGARQYWDTLAG